jgi:hypothetical protein
MNIEKYHYRNFPKFPYMAKTARIEVKPKQKETKPMTSEQLRSEHPEVFAAVQTEARESERTRLAALDAMMAPGLEAVIASAKADGRMPEQIAMECFNLTRAELTKSAATNALQKDAAAAGSVKAGDAPVVPPVDEKRAKGATLFQNAMRAQKPVNRMAQVMGNGQ